MEDINPIAYADEIEEKFYKSCFRLSSEDIMAFDAVDNGPINNVIAGLDRHCFGVNLQKNAKGLIAGMFYIDGKPTLKGDIIELRLADPHNYELLLRFCLLLADDYLQVDPINAFNTFQKKLRTFLEKDGYFTITNKDVEQFEGQEAVMFAPMNKGILKIDFIDKVTFYRDFFQNRHRKKFAGEAEFVYLMINAETSLFKIGTSKDPGYRERTLHSKEPSVHLVAKWPCSKTVEKELHRLYKSKRTRGEWFSLNFKDLTEIEKHMNKIIAK